jgi:hypothetical protein
LIPQHAGGAQPAPSGVMLQELKQRVEVAAKQLPFHFHNARGDLAAINRRTKPMLDHLVLGFIERDQIVLKVVILFGQRQQ